MPVSTQKTAFLFRLAVLAVMLLAVHSFSALPELKVSTLSRAAINSPAATLFTQAQQTANNCQNHLIYTHRYVPMTLTLTGTGNTAYDISVSGYRDSIRGRGNSTWAGDKKPYRIKFNEAKAMFGSKKHKSWALLANWYDQTFTLNAVGFELGKRVGLEGTPNQYLVDFYLNDEYKGIYQITDIAHVNKGRLEIDENEGWLVEFDYHCPSTSDEVDFATDYPNSPSGSKLHTFIKSPEDLPNLSGYNFVKNDVNNLMRAMFAVTGFPENGYRDLVDLESVAKYLMLEQFLDNFDFNNKSNASGFPASNFFHKDKGGKIKAGPIWDLDLTGGVEYNTFPKHFTTYRTPVMPRHAFYKRFFDDPVFLAKFKKNWIRHKPDIQAMPGMIDSIAAVVQGSVERNFALQIGSQPCNPTCTRGSGGFPNMPPIVLGNLQAYRDEIAKLKTWWGNRITFFQQEIDNMNIDTTKDIADPPGNTTPAAPSARQQKHTVGLKVAENWLTLTANNRAETVIVSLNGNIIRKNVFTAGSHSVRLGDLPKGMYLVRVELDGVRKMARVAVR
ncbi:MAG: CotH kinase family protein [Chitinispirillales bacterium]|jgi:hypothetical protein|nr:CotH kinase family protein [Chitinispirillales bacterium]